MWLRTLGPQISLTRNVRCLASRRNKGSPEEKNIAATTLPKYIFQGDRSLEVDLESVTADMEEAVERLRNEFSKLRVGRASSSMVENIKVRSEAGTLSPLCNFGTIMAKEPQTLLLNLFDASSGKSVVSALQSSGMDITAVLDGGKILITFPRITMDLRQKMAKGLGEQAEASKRIIRDVRTTVINSTNRVIRDLDLKRQVEVMAQKLYTDMSRKADDLVLLKQKEILS